MTAAPGSERTSGNQYSRARQPVSPRSAVWTSPVNCSQSV
jgi:hypothetical protein